MGEASAAEKKRDVEHSTAILQNPNKVINVLGKTPNTVSTAKHTASDSDSEHVTSLASCDGHLCAGTRTQPEFKLTPSQEACQTLDP